MSELFKQAKPGSCIPVYKELEKEIDPVEYFAKLSNGGKKRHAVLMRQGSRSFGTADPCLVLTGTNQAFELAALNETGKQYIKYLKKPLSFCEKLKFSKNTLSGSFAHSDRLLSEEQLLKQKSISDVIHVIATSLKPLQSDISVPCTVIGSAPSLCFTTTPNDERYTFYFLDNFCMVDHELSKTTFVANALLLDTKKDKVKQACEKTLKSYERTLEKKLPREKEKKSEEAVTYEISEEQFLSELRDAKRQLADDKAIICYVSRKGDFQSSKNPLTLHQSISSKTDVLFMNTESGTLLAPLSETSCSTKENGQFTIAIETGKRPNHKTEDSDLENKYDFLLKTDEGEMVHHTIAVDTARNAAARVSAPGTRHVTELGILYHTPTTQVIRSKIAGTLNKGYAGHHAVTAMAGHFPGTIVVCAQSDGNLAATWSDALNYEKSVYRFTDMAIMFLESNEERQLNATTHVSVSSIVGGTR